MSATNHGKLAYIVARSDPYLRKMILDEGKIDKENNYKKSIRNAMLDVIQEKYLYEEVEYVSASNVADDQGKLYIISQDDAYNPFAFLKTDLSSVSNFRHSQINDATGIVFWFRIEDKEFWAYQHLWSISIPNKKKNNLLSKILNFEDNDYFAEQKDTLLTIANKIDLLIINDFIITSNISLMQKSFGFKDFIVATAKKSIDRIVQKKFVANTDKLTEYINRGKTSKYAKKMMRIANSKVLELEKDRLMERIHSLNRWKGKFQENEEGYIVLNTYVEVESLIDLLDERWTRSDVTDQEYDTDVKQVAELVAQ